MMHDAGLYCMYGIMYKIQSGTTLILFLDPPMYNCIDFPSRGK